jgi:hypothetical protein
MKGDFSRKTFDRARHYGGVLMQQGRVQLDADWNEQLAIQRHRDETEALDVIGACGAPKHEAGFGVQPAPDGLDLLISPGRYYVHGRMCELEGSPVEALFQTATEVTVGRWHLDGADFAPKQYVELRASGVVSAVVRVSAVTPATRRLTFASSIAAFASATGLTVRRVTTYLTQPDLPSAPFGVPPGPGLPPELDLPDGAYLLYLDVWRRHLTALDDDRIREKALGGPDTATRIKTVWQLKLWPGPGEGAPLPAGTVCETPVAGFDAMTRPSTGRLAARTEPAPPTDDPCILPPGAGYLGLENQLYRVEIHKGGTLGTDPITIKWSRDNGSVVKALVKIPTTTDYTVSDTGPDDVLGLANGQWMEQVDDEIDLKAIPRNLFPFTMDPVTGKVTLPFAVDETRHPQVRRWDSPDQVAVPFPPVGGGWIDLESGIQVRLEPGTYRTGDYWLIPARTVLGDIEWPKDGAGQPLARLRDGIRHVYCRVGVLTVAGGVLTVLDCRNEFPPLTEIKSSKSYSCCTYTVGDGTKYVGDFTLVQDAVDHLPAEGGHICVFPGTYVGNVRIAGRRNVHIKGCGMRTRLVSAPPAAGGAAGPVIHIEKSQGVTIESLAIEAAETAAGILADGETPSRRLVFEKVWIVAIRDSGIKVRTGQDVKIERCVVRMKDPNGRWPGIFLRATDATVRETEVLGTILEMPPEKVFTLKGALVVGGLQIGGGSERVRVHENLFHGLSGQGITLGSMVELDANGRPDPGGGGGWVADGDDPCNNCDEPSSGDRPPGDGGDDRPPRLQSEGDLYDIDIRRNRIFDVGLDGIGVVHFFDLGRAKRAVGLVRVEDLAIVENRIQRSVRRAFAPIPPNMIDLMAYGGISLAVVEGLVIRDNRIEDVGVGGLLPVCGIFVLDGEGVEIGRNHVLNTGLAGRLAAAVAAAGGLGRRGGIHVVYARTLQVAVTAAVGGGDAAAFEPAAVTPARVRRVDVAVVVEENTVDVVRGQALSLGVLGPVSVVSNRLISHGLVPLDLALLRQVAGNPLAHLSSLVAIVALGGTGAAQGPTNMNSSLTYQPAGKLLAARQEPTSGNVLFDDNQCLLDLMHDSERGPALPGNLLLPAILILSMDDLGFQDNQCDCLVREGQLMTGALLMSLFSVRVVSNRFKETLGRALFSAVSFALMNMTAHNQANHCLMVVGPLPVFVQDKPNHVLVDAFSQEYCSGAERTFTEALLRLVS